jgi:two-component system phosphate regulon sensor histidine kinase PhoR
MHLDAHDPAALLGEATERLRPQAERARLNLRVEIEPGLPPVLADPARISQVIVNLVHNAIKFTPEGGSITVRAGGEGGHVRISVEDTGIGIAETELDRLFERFYKADKGRATPGTGLGLAIAKHIVQAHGGKIGAESTPGAGTTIWFTLRSPNPGPGRHAREADSGRFSAPAPESEPN